MNRWWDNATAASSVLELVDDSDVAQGVGTSVLGYHALAKAALAPLAARTLVDPADVVQTLSEVDRAQVARALSAATSSVMGEAADRYGELLANQLHEDAVSGVEHAIRVWTAAGVPMPLALERAADVVGVPVQRIGKYAHAVKAPAVPPAVRSDAADRALMEYASHIGKRESVPGEPVSKSSNFEAQHPRAEDGRFADKPVTRSTDSRRERLKRLAALSRDSLDRQKQIDRSKKVESPAPEQRAPVERAARQLAPRQAQSASQLNSLGSIARETVAAQRQAVAPAAAQATAAPGAAPTAPVNAASAVKSLLDRVSNTKDEVQKIHVNMDMAQVAFVSRDIANKIAAEGGFNAEALERMAPGGLVFQTHGSASLGDEFEAAQALYGDDLVAIAIYGTISAKEVNASAGSFGSTSPRDAVSDLVLSSESSYSLAGFLSGVESPLRGLPTGDFAYGPPEITGSMDIELRMKGPVVEGRAPVTKRVAAIMLKLDDASVEKSAERWRDGLQHEITRNEDGEFAESPSRRRSSSLRARLNVAQRIQSAQAQRLRAAQPRTTEVAQDQPRTEQQRAARETDARPVSRADRSLVQREAAGRQRAADIIRQAAAQPQTATAGGAGKNTSKEEAAELTPSGYSRSKAFMMDLDDLIDASYGRGDEAVHDPLSTYPEIDMTDYRSHVYAKAMKKFSAQLGGHGHFIPTEETFWWWKDNGCDRSYRISHHPGTGDPVPVFATYEDAVSAAAEIESFERSRLPATPDGSVTHVDNDFVPVQSQTEDGGWEVWHVIYRSALVGDSVMVFGSERAMAAMKAGRPIMLTISSDDTGVDHVIETYGLESDHFGAQVPLMFTAFVEER